jgi:hypothetical protein
MDEAMAAAGSGLLAKGIPFAKHAIAASATGIDVVTGNVDLAVEDISESYNRYKQGIEDSAAQMEAKHPISFGTGELAGAFGLAAVPGMQCAAGATFLGAAYGLSNSESQGIKDMAVDMAAGGLLGKAGHMLGVGIGKGIDKLGKGFASMADDTMRATLDPAEKSKFMVKSHNLLNRSYGGNTPEGRALFAKDLAEAMDVEFALTPREALSNIKAHREVLGEVISETIQFVDDASTVLKGSSKLKNGGILKAELINAAGSMDEAVFKGVKGMTPAERNAFSSSVKSKVRELIESKTIIKDTIEEGFEYLQKKLPDGSTDYVKVPIVKNINKAKDFNAKDIFQMKVGLAKDIENVYANELGKIGKIPTPSDSMQMKADTMKLVSKLSNVLDDQVSKVLKETGDEALHRTFQEANRKYGTTLFAEEYMSLRAAEMSSSAPKFVKNLFSLRSAIFAGMTATAVGVGPQGAMMLSGAISLAARTPGATIKTAQGLQKLSNFLAKNPNHKIHGQIMTAMSVSSEALHEKISSSIAKVNLMENAVARDTKDVISKANSIGSVLRDEMGDDAAQQFYALIESGDENSLAGFMDSISKAPNAGQYVQPGLGFNGKVYSEADKAMLEGKINSMDISLHQKLQHKKSLKLEGTIPVVQQEPERFFQMRKRDKNKPSY